MVPITVILEGEWSLPFTESYEERKTGLQCSRGPDCAAIHRLYHTMYAHFPYAGIHTPKCHENYDSDFFNHHKHPMHLANDFRGLFLGLEKWFSS